MMLSLPLVQSYEFGILHHECFHVYVFGVLIITNTNIGNADVKSKYNGAFESAPPSPKSSANVEFLLTALPEFEVHNSEILL